MLSTTQTKLIDFLRHELEVPDIYINMAQARGEDTNLLPMVLWQDGSLDLEQLAKVFDYLEKTCLL